MPEQIFKAQIEEIHIMIKDLGHNAKIQTLELRRQRIEINKLKERMLIMQQAVRDIQLKEGKDAVETKSHI